MDEIEIKKFSFWGFIKDNPLMYYPILVIVSISVMNIFLDSSPLMVVGLRMVLWIAFGFQWVGFARNHEKRKIANLEFDKDRLKTYAELSQITGESIVRFLVPYEEKFISRTWNRMRNMTTLSLFVTTAIGSFESFTKLHATNKEMFEMQLKGCINTNDRVLALKGLEILHEGKKLVTIL